MVIWIAQPRPCAERSVETDRRQGFQPDHRTAQPANPEVREDELLRRLGQNRRSAKKGSKSRSVNSYCTLGGQNFQVFSLQLCRLFPTRLQCFVFFAFTHRVNCTDPHFPHESLTPACFSWSQPSPYLRIGDSVGSNKPSWVCRYNARFQYGSEYQNQT